MNAFRPSATSLRNRIFYVADSTFAARQIFNIAENDISFSAREISHLRSRYFIAKQGIAAVGLNSIVSGFPTLIEVRRSRKRHCLSAENSMAFAALIIHLFCWNLFQFFYHHFCGLVNVTAAESDDDIALFCVLQGVVNNLLKGVEPYTAGNFICKVLCVNAVGVNLA